MCYNISQTEKKAKRLELRYGETGAWSPDKETVKSVHSYYFVSGFQHPDLTVLTRNGFTTMSWGLIPYTGSDLRIRNQTLNARSEDIFETRSYKGLIHPNRCILPVTGFIEFRHYQGKKYPYHIYSPDPQGGQEIISLACIFNNTKNQDTGQMVKTLSIVTTEAQGLMRCVHNSANRSPVILPPDVEAAWLDPMLTKGNIQELMSEYTNWVPLHAYTISTAANNSRNDRNYADILDEEKYDIPPVYRIYDPNSNSILLNPALPPT